MFAPFFGGNCPTEKPPRAGEDISTANALPAVGRWRCSPVFNSKVTNRPNCCAVEQQFKTAAHLDSSSSVVLSHEAAERPLSLVLFLSRLSRNRKTKLWRALLLSGRLTQLFSDREKRLLIADVHDVPMEARPPIDDMAKTDEFTRHGRSWALCDSSQLRPSSSLEPQLITFDQRANESQEA